MLVNETLDSFILSKSDNLNEMRMYQDPDDPNKWKGPKPKEPWQDDLMDYILDSKDKILSGKDFEDFADYLVNNKSDLAFMIDSLNALLTFHQYIIISRDNRDREGPDIKDGRYYFSPEFKKERNLKMDSVSLTEYDKGWEKIHNWYDDDEHWGDDDPPPDLDPSPTGNYEKVHVYA